MATPPNEMSTVNQTIQNYEKDKFMGDANETLNAIGGVSTAISTDVENKNNNNSTTNDDSIQLRKGKNKRKKSAEMDSAVIINELIENASTHTAVAIDYTIVQHDNKRQKIEISIDGRAIVDANLNHQHPQEQSIIPAKPLIPVKLMKSVGKVPSQSNHNKLRTKFENIHAATVQKLTAHAEQLRLEISNLRAALANEQNAVRTLRAQNDANFRKEKIQTLKRCDHKSREKIAKDENVAVVLASRTTTTTNSNNNGQQQERVHQVDRLMKEIESLKEANKQLAIKVQKSSKADRQKIIDIQQLKDSYEHRLAQMTKSSKIEIHRLLEEIKSKEKTIISLRKDVQTFKEIQHKPSHARHEKNSIPKMRKKEIELCNGNANNSSSNATMTTTTNTNNNSNNNICSNDTKNTSSAATNDSTTQTTCRHDIFTMPHEMRDRIMNVQNDLQFCKSKDLSGSDNDSALSSAPPSLSPQPGTQSNSPDVWQALLKESKDHENLQKEYDLIKEENQFLNCEITLAEEQIRELEKVLQMTRENNKTDELLERIHHYECKEAIILKESHELREQNELLEFRIIELEEGSSDKFPTNVSKRDAWTCMAIDNELTLPATRRMASSLVYDKCTIFSNPNCLCGMNSPDQLPSDYIRRNILAMSKHSCFDEKDRLSLLQVLSLLNNLEALSYDKEISFDDENISFTADKVDRYHSTEQSSPNNHHHQNIYRNFSTSSPKSNERVIATVQPYSNHQTIDDASNNITHLKPTVAKLSPHHFSFTSSMNESGVFEGDLLLSQLHQSTQTHFEDFPTIEQATLSSSDLCAEIQKLNKFRKRIEDCVSMSTNQTSVDIGVLSPLSKLDETRLQYYRDRLELLENKVLIYESSGDVQLKRLAARLQKEIQLESQLKQSKQRIEKLEAENHRLDDERCELEEIENDTRLQLQRLEVDLEMLSQRNSELEMSRDTARANVECLQETVSESHEQMLAIEADRNGWQQKFELITAFMPAILLFNTWKSQQQEQKAIELIEWETSTIIEQPAENNLVTTLVAKNSECSCNQEHICPEADKFVELVRRERELTDSIAELNRAYNETLERADNLWAQMERDYKEKLNRSQEDNALLRSKITQLEKRLKNDAHYAQERIAQLEDEENMLKRRLAKLNRVSRDDADKYKSLQSDYHSLSGEYEKLKSYVDGPMAENLEKERKKTRTMEEEMRMASKMYNDLEQLHRTQMNVLKSKLEKSKKELLSIEISNSELKEEVVQLEHRIIELNRCRREDEDRIKSLITENRCHEESNNSKPIKPMRIKHNSRNLAQELGSFGRSSINSLSNMNNNFNYTSVYALNSVAAKISDSIKNFEVNREPIRHQFD